MNLNGSLKEIFLNLYQKDTQYYDESFLKTSDYLINYQGQITFFKAYEQQIWLDIYQKFINGQFAEVVYTAHNNYSSPINAEIEYLARLIKSSDNRLALITLENLNKLLANNITLNVLKNYSNFIDFLALYLNQLNSFDISLAFSLFLANKEVTYEKIIQKKREIFKILAEDLKDEETLKLYNLGEFVNPHRLANISPNLLSPSSAYSQILPLYILEIDPLKAQRILNYYQNKEYDKAYQEATPSLLKLSKK